MRYNPIQPPSPHRFEGFYLVAVILALAAIGFSILYGYILWISVRWPTAMDNVQNGIGCLLFSCASASAWFLSLGLWIEHHKSWNLEQKLTFLGAIGLAVVLIVVALQFVLVGEWGTIHPQTYARFRDGSYLALFAFLFWSYWKTRNDKHG